MNPLSRWGRLLGITPIPADVSEELAALRQQMAEFTRAESEHQRQTTALREALEKADKQIARAGKELFKTNSLAEALQQSFKTLLDQLREANTARDRELAQLREQLSAARAEGRMDMIKRLLSVLDGLNEALDAGRHMLAEPVMPNEPAPFSHRIAAAWNVLHGNPPAQMLQHTDLTADHADIAAWLTGLELVRDRLLDILAGEEVRPIATDGALFDPNYHVAIEAVAATDGTQPGAIVQVTRRGYRAGDTVLRYAEVIVAR